MEQVQKSYFMCNSMGQAEWKIFVLDLSGYGPCSSVSVNRCPTVRLDGKVFSNWYFCIVGSTLYGFEGVDVITDCGGKMIYEFELPSDDEANMELETHMFTPVCEMRDRNFFPVAVACPSGRKIIVISGFKNKTSFDLFDVVGRFCSRLRIVPTVPRGNAHIRSRCFISETEFVLEMEYGAFKINVGRKDPKWKSLKNFYGGKIPRIYYKVIGNDLCVTPRCAYSIVGLPLDLDCQTARCVLGEDEAYDSMHRWNYFYPDAFAIHPDYEKYATASIIVLSDGREDDDFCEFCILKAGENVHTEEEVMVTLEVYQCNLARCRIELLSNSQMEDVLAQEKMEQIQKWSEELSRGGEYDLMKSVEYCRKRDYLMGRELRPLPHTRLRMSYCFTFKANGFYLRDFSSIPRGI